MSITTRRLTYEDLIQLPADGNRYELIDGDLQVTPAPSRRHQRLAFRLTLLVGGLVEAEDLGELYFAPVDVRLSPHDVVQPDLIFITKARRGIFVENVVEGAPDLVIEILSPSTRINDEVRKARLYAAAGIPEYWIADALTERFSIYVLVDGTYREVPHQAGSVRSTVLPGLVIDVAALFDDLDE